MVEQSRAVHAQRAATIRDVAKRAGVSVGTVSNLLSGRKHVVTETRRRIEAAIRDLGYVPNSGARVMQGARSHSVALLVPDSTNPFFADVVRGIEDVAFDEQHVVIVCNTEGDPAREAHYARALAEMRVRGVIAVASATGDAVLSRLSEAGAEVVRLGRADQSQIPSVGVDDETGGWLAGSHLVSLGHTRLCFIGGPGAEPQIEGRLAGFRRAIAGHVGVSLERADVPGSSTSARLEGARQIIARLALPAGVFCANDQIAAAVESVAIQAGLSIPEDLAVVGYDDTEVAKVAAIPLTTIRQPSFEIGREAGRLAMGGRRQGGFHIQFTPELVQRESTVGSARIVPESGDPVS